MLLIITFPWSFLTHWLAMYLPIVIWSLEYSSLPFRLFCLFIINSFALFSSINRFIGSASGSEVFLYNHHFQTLYNFNFSQITTFILSFHHHQILPCWCLCLIKIFVCFHVIISLENPFDFVHDLSTINILNFSWFLQLPKHFSNFKHKTYWVSITKHQI